MNLGRLLKLKRFAAEGHEIASHTVTHARLAILDEDNLLYELEQSKADIQHFLGEKYTFSAECPYGTENISSVAKPNARILVKDNLVNQKKNTYNGKEARLPMSLWK